MLGAVVTPHFFDVLGVAPEMGGGFTAENDTPGSDSVVILSHALWQRRYGGDPEIVGRAVIANGQPFEVVGVMPASFRHPEPHTRHPTEIWKPLPLDSGIERGFRYLRGLGRLAEGTTLAEARTEMTAIARRLEEAYPDSNTDMGVEVVPLHEEIFGDVRPALLLLLGAAGLVMLIGCVNVANLVLARGHGRRREFAVRTALGASRRHLLVQLIGENVLVSATAGALSLLVVAWSADLLRSVQTRYLSATADIRVDGAVMLFTALVAGAIGVVFGMLSAVPASRTDLRTALASETAGSTGASRRARRLRHALVVAEVALATVLLIGAGLLTRSFRKLTSVAPGFESEDLLTFSLSPPVWRYPEQNDYVRFYGELQWRLGGLPGVSETAIVSSLPFTTENSFATVTRDDEPRGPGDGRLIELHLASPAYFQTMGIALIHGRVFAEDDDSSAPTVAVVNETMARREWSGQDPVGRRFIYEAGSVTVIGVVADTRDDGFGTPPEPNFFLPFEQQPYRHMAVLVRTGMDPESLIGDLRRELSAVDPDIPLIGVETMQNLMSSTVAPLRLTMLLATAFSVLALLLAGIGIYGVMAYTVSLRTREIGIRSALGARRQDVLGLVIRQSMAVALTGVGVGIVAALGSSRVLESFLYGVASADLATVASVVLTLTAVAFLATYIPAKTASRVDPMVAMRTVLK